MARSFQIVENKIRETDFFLDKLKNAENSLDLYIANFFLSAFLSSSRSITFCIQASISDLDNFNTWYNEQQQNLKENPLSTFFHFARNHSQKVGYYPITEGFRSNEGINKFRFDTSYAWANKKKVPEKDVISSCQSYFINLLEIVNDCYKVFGYTIDPNKYYSIQNMQIKGLTIEDFEEELGYPREWTNIPNSTLEQRLSAIQRVTNSNCVDDILLKYLGIDRFGNKYNNL